MHLSPFLGLNLSRIFAFRNIAHRIAPLSSFNVKYICPEDGLDRLDISPITETSLKLDSRSFLAALLSSPTEIISLFCSKITSLI